MVSCSIQLLFEERCLLGVRNHTHAADKQSQRLSKRWGPRESGKKHLLLILQKESKASFSMLGREKASPPLPPLAVSRVENCDSCLTK